MLQKRHYFKTNSEQSVIQELKACSSLLNIFSAAHFNTSYVLGSLARPLYNFIRARARHTAQKK